MRSRAVVYNPSNEERTENSEGQDPETNRDDPSREKIVKHKMDMDTQKWTWTHISNAVGCG